MGVPEHVAVAATSRVRSYSSPPRRARSWMADRPGESIGRVVPDGGRLGTPGPDQGYALLLAAELAPAAKLREGEHRNDVLAGAAAIAMKRSGWHGRAPGLDDVEAGLIVWGYLDTSPAPELVAPRRGWFAEIHSPHQYEQCRKVVDAVRAEMLLQPLEDIGIAHAEDWRELLDLDA